MNAPRFGKGSQIFPDDLEMLPEGSVVDGTQIESDRADIADYVVIGSGAAGATSALELSRAGHSVIIIEEGPWVRTRDFSPDVFVAMSQMFRDMGSNMATGRAMFPLIQGVCVGGSTTINSAIAWRPPEDVVDGWNSKFGLKGAITFKDLDPHFSELEKQLSVKPVGDEIAGNDNRLFGEAAQALGIKAHRVQRYDGGCEASASCLTGCRTAKKLGMNVSFVPQSLHAGAKIYTSAKAMKILSSYGRATGVLARFGGRGRPTVTVHARRGVIVAASAVQTPGVLQRTGIKLPALGKFFQVHLATSMTAQFKQEIGMEFGATQGFNSTHFVGSDRLKLEALCLPPEMTLVRLPGVGRELMDNLMNYQRLLNWAVVIRPEAYGTVGSLLSKTMVRYTASPTDVSRVRKALKLLSEMAFAVGATKVFPSINGVPDLNSPDDLHVFDDASVDPRDYGIMASHMFGGARMGPDAATSTVGLDFQVHHTRGIYVLDSSLFPTNLGVNPQHTIMGVARLGTTRILETPLPARG